MANSSGSSYVSSEETTNYARMCRIVVDVLRDILWQVLRNEIPPADLPKKVQTDRKKLGKLDLEIKTWLCGIFPPSTEIPSAEKFDVSSLYTLIRNLCSQVPTPSRQWGQIPPAGGITLGDDIERVREFRNTLYGHATQAKIETADFNKLCIEIKNAVRRFDAYFCSLSTAMKCDFECEIDTILTCFMDKILEDDYIEKVKQIAILLDDLGDIKQQVDVLMKKVDNVQDTLNDVQKDTKENAEDSRNRLCRMQETLEMLDMEKEKDKVEDTTYSLVNEERDCNENAGISREDIALEMPPGMEGKIRIIKCYADLKLELERDKGMDIAKGLFKKEKHKDVLEEIANAGRRRHCIDQLLKRVLQLEASGLKIFFDLLKRECRERAKKLSEIKVTDKDRKNFTQVSESVKMAPHRIQNGLKFEQLDVEFFKCHFQDIPEKVDKRADVLLSQFHISICDHSQMIKVNDPEKKIHALLEKIQSCHFDSDLEVKSMLGSKLYQKWQCFKVDGSRQGLENQGIWHYVQERIQISKEYLIKLFRGLGIYFMQAQRGSLVLKFVTLDNFDVTLLTPEAVKTKVCDMIKTLCPEYQDVFKEPVHLTIFLKPLSNTDSAEIHFYLETSKEKEEFSCMKLGSHDKQYFLEEMNSASLNNWMFNTLQLDEDTKTKLVDLVSRKDMSRRKKMKILLNIVESLGNGYELLEKYCEEHDTFLYDEVFKKHRQVKVEENPDLAQQYEFSEEGLQRLFSTWIDFTVDPKDKDKVKDVSDSLIDEKHARQLEKEDADSSHESSQSTKEKMGERKKEDGAHHGLYLEDSHSKERGLMTDASKQSRSFYKNPSHSLKEQYSKDIYEGVRDQNGRMLDEIIRNFASENKVKNILLVGLPSVGKSSLINSLASLILGKYIPVASVGQGAAQLTHTYAAHRYNHFGIREEHLKESPNEVNAREMYPHLPNLYDFVGLADANTEELKEILSLQIFGHLEPGLQITSLFKSQSRHGVGSLRSWYTKSEEDWKIDVVFFVHSVATSEVPTELIQCLLDIIKPKDTLRPVDVEFYVVLTKMDKVEAGVITEDKVNAIENAVADSFGIHGLKEYKLVKITNWCDDVGFPNSSADNLDRLDERSVTLNNQMLKLLRNMSTPKAELKITHDITFIQKMWFCFYDCLTTVIRMFHFEPFGPRDILYAALFGLLLIIVVFLLIVR